MVHGLGTQSCGNWTSYRRAGGYTDLAPQAWIQGYISALNFSVSLRGEGPDIMQGTDAEGIFAWVDNYCAAHPLNSISQAALDLATDLRSKQMVAGKPQQ